MRDNLAVPVRRLFCSISIHFVAIYSNAAATNCKKH